MRRVLCELFLLKMNLMLIILVFSRFRSNMRGRSRVRGCRTIWRAHRAEPEFRSPTGHEEAVEEVVEEVSLSSSDESMEVIERPNGPTASALAPGSGNSGSRRSPSLSSLSSSNSSIEILPGSPITSSTDLSSDETMDFSPGRDRMIETPSPQLVETPVTTRRGSWADEPEDEDELSRLAEELNRREQLMAEKKERKIRQCRLERERKADEMGRRRVRFSLPPTNPSNVDPLPTHERPRGPNLADPRMMPIKMGTVSRDGNDWNSDGEEAGKLPHRLVHREGPSSRPFVMEVVCRGPVGQAPSNQPLRRPHPESPDRSRGVIPKQPSLQTQRSQAAALKPERSTSPPRLEACREHYARLLRYRWGITIRPHEGPDKRQDGNRYPRKLRGCRFGNLKNIPTDHNLDYSPRACFNCRKRCNGRNGHLAMEFE